jgi:probable HAF family extracellular repeat protein
MNALAVRVCRFVSTSRRSAAVVAAVAGAVIGVAARAQSAPRYAVIDLGTTVGAGPTAVSDGAFVSGTYFAANGQRRGFVWNNGAAADIGTLGGIAQALAVNDTGLVVGYSVDTQNRQRAVRVVGGVMSDLGVLAGGVHANANDVNDTGWAVGMSQKRFGNDVWQRAALWRNGSVQDLGTFGGEFSEATGVNNAGHVVGWAWHPFPQRNQRAFIWSDVAGMIDLGTLGGSFSSAADVNDAGVVVGVSGVQPGSITQHAFVWSAQTGMIDLGAPAGADSYVSAINNAGQIVGTAFFFEDCSGAGLLWQGGEMHLLHELVDPAAGWTVVGATDINNAGWISAVGHRPGELNRAVLLVPIAAPTATPGGFKLQSTPQTRDPE